MFRPILDHHQRDKLYQHLKEMLYVASEGHVNEYTRKQIITTTPRQSVTNHLSTTVADKSRLQTSTSERELYGIRHTLYRMFCTKLYI
jgi:hypothetical protein